LILLLHNRPIVPFDATSAEDSCLRIHLIGLLLAQDLFDSKIPKPFAVRLQKDQRAVSVALQISSNLLTSSPPTSGGC